MKPRDYEKAWHTLKEDMMDDYVCVHKQADKIKHRVSQCYESQVANLIVAKDELQTWLMHMDYLDGTHEFSNLKHDLERGGKQ